MVSYEEVNAAWRVWKFSEINTARMHERLHTPSIGARVFVTAGKLPYGTEAVVSWYGESKFHDGEMVVRIEVGGKPVFVNANNVRVLLAEEDSRALSQAALGAAGLKMDYEKALAEYHAQPTPQLTTVNPEGVHDVDL